jgi:hypothetical protein
VSEWFPGARLRWPSLETGLLTGLGQGLDKVLPVHLRPENDPSPVVTCILGFAP